jgi:hypothetical protein
MRVLVTEDELGSSASAVRDLAAAGHDVVTCQPFGATVHPCIGLAGGVCPLAGGVDVAVAVHGGRGGRAITGREFGVVCAGRSGVPLVAVATRGHNPLPGFPVTSAECVVAAAERVATGELRPGPAEVVAAVRHVLTARGLLRAVDEVRVEYADGPDSYDVLVAIPAGISGISSLIEARVRAASEVAAGPAVPPLRHVVVKALG